MKNIDKYLVKTICSIKQAVQKMDDAGIGFCVCIDDNKQIIGVLSDGDFRRAVLDGKNLDEPVSNIINKEFISLSTNYNKEDVENIFLNSAVKHIPIIDSGKLVDIVIDDFNLFNDKEVSGEELSFHVVIMAGGKGTRLDPFTRILPKPLLPIGNEPIIKLIMDEFSRYKISKYYISLNSKAQMVKAYFHDHNLPYQIKYIEEKEPLGTAGAIKYVENYVSNSFFVTNCDIIIKTDYSDIVDFHTRGGYSLTLVASMRHYEVPYGVCEVQHDGELVQIKEKPQYDYLVNAGMYFINKQVLELIPKGIRCDMTDVIKKVKNAGLRVGVFPVSEKSWVDIGQWSEFNKTFENLKDIKKH